MVICYNNPENQIQLNPTTMSLATENSKSPNISMEAAGKQGQRERECIRIMFRNDKTIPDDTFIEASTYYSAVRQGFREKADHNKRESQLCFSLIIACTLTAPLFVTLGASDLWAKGVPSALSVLAGGLTSWLQLRKPQRLWMIYRRAQRELEEHKANFDFRDGDFADCTNADQLLARKVTSVSRWVHDAWEGMVPEQEFLTKQTKLGSNKSE